MAAVFDFETERAQRVLDDAVADRAFRVALERAESIGGRTGIKRLRRYEREIAAVESRLLAERVRDDGNTRDAERLLDDGKTSRREQRRRAKRAKAVDKNGDLADKMASGELSEEHVDVIADASDKTKGEAASDSALIDEIGSVPPDQAKGIADDYVASRATKDDVQTEHNRQRALRRTTNYCGKKDGLENILLGGDAVAAKAMRDAIATRSNALYVLDGGRDMAASKHPRTTDQRNFDAAYELICGVTVNPDGTTTENSAPPETPTHESASTTGGSRRHTPRAARPRIVIGLTLEQLLDANSAESATQIGLGLIPDSVLANYAAHADIVAALFDRNGEPLWMARLSRYATTTQMIALILRDRGCVLCGADHTRCQAHHTMPWNAPVKGRTDIDQLALMCGPCHRRLHDDHRTLYKDLKGRWQTRPATPDEIAPPRPSVTRNLPQQE